MKTCTKCGKSFPATPEHFYRHGKGLYPQCKPCRYAKVREWVTANPHKYAEYTGRWRAKHREQYNAYDRAYRDQNRDKIRQQQAETRAANRDRFCAYSAERRAMERAGGTYTVADIERQLIAQGGHCRWCSKPLAGRYEVDHVVPLSRSGSNLPENLAITCTPCNRRKSDRLPFDEWMPPNPLPM